MPAIDDTLVARAGEHERRVLSSKRLLEPQHAGEDLLGKHQRIGRPLDFFQANVAGLAALAFEFLAEVLENRPMPAADRLAKVLDSAQHRLRNPRRVGRQVRLQLAPGHEIARRIEQTALGLEPVAAGAAALLLIGLERLGRGRMHDEPNVGFVDAHAEGHRRDDDPRLVGAEGRLIAAAFFVAQAGVVRQRCVSRGLQHPANFVNIAPANAVDDAGLAGVPVDHSEHLLPQVGARGNAVH